MSETATLALPLLSGGQAQKHVTMNEALMRLDALTAPSVISADAGDPPAGADGDVYIVPASATGVWAGRAGSLAFWTGDGWSFATPKPGWRVWVTDRGAPAIWSGAKWAIGAIGGFGFGAHLGAAVIEDEVTFVSGTSFVSSVVIPDRAVVIGVTARVTQAITGAGLTGWRVGVAGSDNRYGTWIGLGHSSTLVGVSGTPTAYYGDTPLLITAEGGAFSGGAARIAIHYLAVTPPDHS